LYGRLRCYPWCYPAAFEGRLETVNPLDLLVSTMEFEPITP
jgi:hypothetical protein